MAWLLAILGTDFWHFNIMELFASVAIIFGVGWAIRGHCKERSRKNSLITFPDTWKATRMLSKESFEVKADIDILLPYNSYSVILYVRKTGKPLKMENLETVQPMGSKTGRVIVTGNTPLASLTANDNEVEVWTKITLDGAIHRKSKKRTLPITNFGNPPSIPDKEGS